MLNLNCKSELTFRLHITLEKVESVKLVKCLLISGLAEKIIFFIKFSDEMHFDVSEILLTSLKVIFKDRRTDFVPTNDRLQSLKCT